MPSVIDGPRLKAARKQHGLTVQAVADASYSNYSTVGNAESGRRRISWRAFFRICDALQIDPLDYIRPV